MKRFNAGWVAAAALVVGLGATASAFAQDPGCYSSCQEQMNDCRAQAVGGPQWFTQHCNQQYRECIASCDAQASVVRPSVERTAFSSAQATGGRCGAPRFVDTVLAGRAGI